MFNGYIYLVTNTVNGKQYVGQTTTTIPKRWKQHVYESNLGRHQYGLYLAIRKYGAESFTVTEICAIKAASRDEMRVALNAAEIEFIKLYGTYENGYNQTLGGGSTEHLTIKVARYDADGKLCKVYESMLDTVKDGFTKTSVSQACSGKLRMHKGYFWRVVDDVVPERIEPNLSTDKRPEINIAMYNGEGCLIGTAKTLLEVRLKLGVPLTTAIVKSRGSIGGYRFLEYVDEPPLLFEKQSKVQTVAKAVAQYALDGTFIAEHKSLRAAGISVGGQGNNIALVCNGAAKVAYGYRWKFIEKGNE